jgi:hypothetical protein
MNRSQRVTGSTHVSQSYIDEFEGVSDKTAASGGQCWGFGGAGQRAAPTIRDVLPPDAQFVFRVGDASWRSVQIGGSRGAGAKHELRTMERSLFVHSKPDQGGAQCVQLLLLCSDNSGFAVGIPLNLTVRTEWALYIATLTTGFRKLQRPCVGDWQTNARFQNPHCR